MNLRSYCKIHGTGNSAGYILILLLFIRANCFAQDIKELKVEETPLKAKVTAKMSNVLINTNGEEGGTFKLEQKYRINFKNGKEIEVPALSNIMFAADADRVVIYGDNICVDMLGYVSVLIYTCEGKFIHKIDSAMQYPISIALSKKGEIYLLGCRNCSTGNTLSSIVKYNENGKFEWEKKIDPCTPWGIITSEDSKFIAVNHYSGSKSKLSIYKSTGNYIGDVEFLDKPYVEFMDNRLAIANNNALTFYSLEKNKLEKIHSTAFDGEITNYFPLLYNAKTHLLLLLSQKGKNLLLQAYDEENGKMKHKKMFEGHHLPNKEYRSIMNNGDKVKLITNNSELNISFNND